MLVIDNPIKIDEDTLNSVETKFLIEIASTNEYSIIFLIPFYTNYTAAFVPGQGVTDGLVYELRIDEGQGSLLRERALEQHSTLSYGSWSYVPNPRLSKLGSSAITQTVFCQGGYRFGFNGQERDDEVSGAGNSLTGMYWQYDARLGRRWNVDPKVKPYESPYDAFGNNPIWCIDPNGADTTLADAGGNTEKISDMGADVTIRSSLSLDKIPTIKPTPEQSNTNSSEPNRYTPGQLRFYKADLSYGIGEGHGINASFNISGSINIDQDLNGDWNARIGATGAVPGMTTHGTPIFTGSVDLINNGRTISTTPLDRGSLFLYQTGTNPIGSATIKLPTQGSVQLRINAGYYMMLPEGQVNYWTNTTVNLPTQNRGTLRQTLP